MTEPDGRSWNLTEGDGSRRKLIECRGTFWKVLAEYMYIRVKRSERAKDEVSDEVSDEISMEKDERNSYELRHGLGNQERNKLNCNSLL